MNVINLGWQATGPLRQYAAYKEFIGNKSIKYIFWVYFENDLEDLAIEINNKIKIVGSPMKFSISKVQYKKSPPTLGADTEKILKNFL